MIGGLKSLAHNRSRHAGAIARHAHGQGHGNSMRLTGVVHIKREKRFNRLHRQARIAHHRHSRACFAHQMRIQRSGIETVQIQIERAHLIVPHIGNDAAKC